MRVTGNGATGARPQVNRPIYTLTFNFQHLGQGISLAVCAFPPTPGLTGHTHATHPVFQFLYLCLVRTDHRLPLAVPCYLALWESMKVSE